MSRRGVVAGLVTRIALVAGAALLFAPAIAGARATAAPKTPKGRVQALAGPSAISLARSTTTPYYACPSGACEAIVDPPPVAVASRFALSRGGALLEGGGELGGLDPQDLRAAYLIPLAGGSTQTIAVVDAYGYQAAEADLAKYRERYGLGPCTKQSGCFRKVNESGEEGKYPGNEGTGWQAETALDLDMASAACPHCHLLLVQATSEFAPDTAASVDTAASLGASEISNSYGYPESYAAWCGQTGCAEFNADYDHPGVAITVSAGDSGWDDYFWRMGAPNFPATSPHVIAVGGTALRHSSNARGWSESVWGEAGRGAGTGSGCSLFESKPAWQLDTGCANRTDNDVAAVAACETPVSVYTTYSGGWVNLCGTSASAPLVAGMLAHESEATRALGAAAFYQEPGALYDVTSGSNGPCTPPAEHAYLCLAQVGYDGPTGLGTPLGAAQVPSVTGVSPSEGPAAGGTSVTISGTGLGEASAVTFGSASAVSFNVTSASSITAVAPPGTGTVDVRVTTPEGTSAVAAGDRFRYLPAGVYPQLGRCVKVGKGAGGFKNAGCSLALPGGSYEWAPGAVKAGFVGSGGKSTFEAVGRAKVVCAGESGAGAYVGLRGIEGLAMRFVGCAMPKVGSCSSAGAGGGEIVSGALEGVLQWESFAARTVVWDVLPAAGSGAAFVSFACGARAIELRGSLLVRAVAGKMAVGAKLKAAAKRGVQAPSEYEAEAGGGRVRDVLEGALGGGGVEQVGLTIAGFVLTGEEGLEVNGLP